jgi:hypothetical protein
MAYEAARYVTGRTLVSMFAPLVLLASPLFILESSKAEVYTLNSFLVMLLFYLCLRAIQEKNFSRDILLSSFVLGIGMGNHHSIGFFLPVIAAVFIIRFRELPKWVLLKSLLFFLAGLFVYLYLFLRTVSDTFLNFSAVFSFDRFLQVFLRTEYSTGSVKAVSTMAGGGSGWLNAVENLFSLLNTSIHPLAWALVVAGLASLIRDRKRFALVLVSLLVWVGLARIAVSGETLSYRTVSTTGVYFLPLVPLLGVVVTAGLSGLYQAVVSRSSLVARGATAALCLFMAFQAASAFQKSSLSDYSIAHTWIKDIAKVMKPKSVYMTFGDNPGFMSFYGFGVERLRDDVLVMDTVPNDPTFRLTLSPEWKFGIWYPDFYAEELTSMRFFHPFANTGRLYVSSGGLSKNLMKDFRTEPYVLVQRLAGPETGVWRAEGFKEAFGMVDYLPIVLGHRKDFMTRELNEDYAFAAWEYAKILRAERNEDTDYYYRLSYLLAGSVLKYTILKDYVRYVFDSRGGAQVQAFLAELKGTAEGEKGLETVEKLSQWYRETLEGEEPVTGDANLRGMRP